MKYAIGIDIGTSATKTVLFDTLGNEIASSSAEYPMYQPHNGWAEQNPEDWWQAVAGTLKDVLEISKVAPEHICALGLSGQMHGLVMLDKDNNVIRNSIIWCDQRTGKECAEIEELIGKNRLIEITANPALTGFTASKIRWVQNNEPENFARCAHILLPKDYIRFKLTGEYASDVSDASGMQLLDIANRCWSSQVISKLGIDESLLPKLYESAEITGRINEHSAKLTGLLKGTPVVAGGGDNACAAVGTGAVTNNDSFTTIGTSGVVFAHTDKMIIDMKGRIHTFCCAVPGKWHVMGVTQGAGLSLKWFKENLCRDLIAEARSKNTDTYILMDEMVKNSPTGANSVIFLPYLMGERTPHLDPNARGVFFGLSAMHGRGDMIRSVMEGVAYSLRDCLNVLRELGINPEKMTVCGGGSKSEIWRGIISDNYEMPVLTIKNSENAALGAAILAMVGAGCYNSVEEACKSIIKTGDIINPDANNERFYSKGYKVYKNLYCHLKDDFTDISRL